MAMFDERKGNETAAPAEEAAPAPADRSPPAPPPKMTNGVSQARDIAVIGPSITIKGDVAGEESLVVDGKVDGTVTLGNHDLTVGQSGVVTAGVTGRVVRIEGQVHADIQASEKVAITRTGRVHGDVVAPRVSLEDGARFKGRIDMDPGATLSSSTPPLKPVT